MHVIEQFALMRWQCVSIVVDFNNIPALVRDLVVVRNEMSVSCPCGNILTINSGMVVYSALGVGILHSRTAID